MDEDDGGFMEGTDHTDGSQGRRCTEIRSDDATLRLAGDLDGRSTPQVRQALNDLLREHRVVTVDLGRVGSVDVPVLRVLAAATHRAHQGGRRLVLSGCGPAVRRLLHLTHLIRAVEVDRESARV